MIFEENGIYICQSNIGTFLIDITGLDDEMPYEDYYQYLREYRHGVMLSEKYFPMQVIKLSDVTDARNITREMGHSSDITNDISEWYRYGIFDWRIMMTLFYESDNGYSPYDYFRLFHDELLRQYDEVNK